MLKYTNRSARSKTKQRNYVYTVVKNEDNPVMNTRAPANISDNEENQKRGSKKKSRLLALPTELHIRIFILSQNPAIATVCQYFYDLSLSDAVRAYYLMNRYGKKSVLGEQPMKRKIVSLGVIQQLLSLRCCDPKANGDYWLFTRACELQQIDLCRWIIEAAIVYYKHEQEKVTSQLLNIAATSGAINIVDLLVNNFGADIHQPNGQDTALTLACRENRTELVKHLYNHYKCNIHAHSEMHLRNACLNGYEDLVDFFISAGCDVHAYGDTALQSASYKGHAQVVKLLVNAGADCETNQNVCIQYAITNGNLKIVEYLISDGRVSPRCEHDWPLRYACRYGLDTIVEYIVTKIVEESSNNSTATVVNIRNGMAIAECLMYGRLSTLSRILSYGADPNSNGVVRGLQYIINSKAKTKNKNAMIELLISSGLDLDRLPQDIARVLKPTSYNNNSNGLSSILSWSYIKS